MRLINDVNFLKVRVSKKKKWEHEIVSYYRALFMSSYEQTIKYKSPRKNGKSLRVRCAKKRQHDYINY